jgi:ribosomal protein S18 acetylase RimI-like enzyme
LIGDAFFEDPVSRWAFADEQQYRSVFPPFVHAFAGRAFSSGTAFGTNGGEGAALWLPPGVHSDEEEIGELIQSLRGTHLADFIGFVELQTSLHPVADHWYLPLLGVHPSKQGLGAGSALLSHALEICDQRAMPAYLEATTEGSRGLYQRHGFEVTGEIQFGSSPAMWPMWRQPR